MSFRRSTTICDYDAVSSPNGTQVIVRFPHHTSQGGIRSPLCLALRCELADFSFEFRNTAVQVIEPRI
jgi:hypothetical protein